MIMLSCFAYALLAKLHPCMLAHISLLFENGDQPSLFKVHKYTASSSDVQYSHPKHAAHYEEASFIPEEFPTTLANARAMCLAFSCAFACAH